MPYKKRKQKCKQSDGTSGSYVLSYTDKKGKKHRACHTSQKKMQGQIAAIEGPRENDASEGDDLNELRELIRGMLVISESKKYAANYELADAIASGSGGSFKANVNQGAIKGRKPHTRIAATPELQKQMKPIIDELSAAGGFPVMYKDGTLEGKFRPAFESALGTPAVNIIGLAGAPGEYSDKFPAYEVEFTGQSGEPQRLVLVPTFASARVAKGKVYQDSTSNIISKALSSVGATVQDVKTAKPGSQAPDVQISATGPEGESIVFNLEVKGPGGKFFDKTVQRGKPASNADLKMIDDIAAAMATANGYTASTLEEYIDALQEAGEQNVGYIGDPGITQKSGALPKAFFSAPMTPAILTAIQSHWQDGGDTYFVVADGTTSYVWFTGNPAPSGPPNPLDANPFGVDSVQGGIQLSTYGSAGPGRLRVALTAKFNLGSAKALTESPIREYVRSMLLTEAFSSSDKTEIARIFKKEFEKSSATKKMIRKEVEAYDSKTIPGIVDKAFKKNFDKELRKALGASFFGTPGKINKFVTDEIQKEVTKSLGSQASKDVIILVCKEVIKKLYRELSFSSPQIIDRINPKV